MSRFQIEPDPRLRPFVHSYWGLTRDLSERGGFTITPDCFLELIFFVDPPWVEGTSGGQPLPACTLIPLLDQPLRLVVEGVVRCAAIRLYAWAAGLVLPQADTAHGRWHEASADFADLTGPVTAALRDGSGAKVAAVFDEVLLRAFARTPPSAPLVDAVKAFATLPDESPPATINAVAARHERSRRQVERQVRTLTHHSPKQLSSLARFQFVRDALWAWPDVELAALAFQAGYADQAHMTRHFRRYAAQTPGEFIRDCARLKSFVRSQDVAIVQDAPREAR